MSEELEALLLRSGPPLLPADLGPGAALLVPNGAAFGTPQLWRKGVAFDWVRKKRDAYWVEGDRGSSHGGVDFGFFVKDDSVHHLPVGMPVRSPIDARVEEAGPKADSEGGPGAVVLALGPRRLTRLYVHLTGFEVSVRAGASVRCGSILGRTTRFSRRFPIVVLHLGAGVLLAGWDPNPLDPTPMLERWNVRHPVRPGSSCDAALLNRGRPGKWIAPGRIEGLAPVARWDRRWKDSY